MCWYTMFVACIYSFLIHFQFYLSAYYAAYAFTNFISDNLIRDADMQATQESKWNYDAPPPHLRPSASYNLQFNPNEKALTYPN